MTMQEAAFIGMGLIVLYAFGALVLAIWSSNRQAKNEHSVVALKH